MAMRSKTYTKAAEVSLRLWDFVLGVAAMIDSSVAVRPTRRPPLPVTRVELQAAEQ